MAITVKIEEKKDNEVSFPCLMKDVDSELVVLFTSMTEGTVVNAGGTWVVGQAAVDWVRANNPGAWEPSPPITLSNS